MFLPIICFASDAAERFNMTALIEMSIPLQELVGAFMIADDLLILPRDISSGAYKVATFQPSFQTVMIIAE